MEKRRYDEAQALFDSVIPKLREFGADHKEIMALLGQPCGPSRPPAKTTSDEKRAALYFFARRPRRRSQATSLTRRNRRRPDLIYMRAR